MYVDYKTKRERMMNLTKEQQIEDLRFNRNKCGSEKTTATFLPPDLLKYAIEKNFNYRKLDDFLREKTADKQYGRPQKDFTHSITYVDSEKRPILRYWIKMNPGGKDEILRIEGFKYYSLREFIVKEEEASLVRNLNKQELEKLKDGARYYIISAPVTRLSDDGVTYAEYSKFFPATFHRDDINPEFSFFYVPAISPKKPSTKTAIQSGENASWGQMPFGPAVYAKNISANMLANSNLYSIKECPD